MIHPLSRCALALAALLPFTLGQAATAPPTTPTATAPAAFPDLNTLLAPPQSELRIILQRYEADRALLNRLYDVSITARRIARMKRFDADWLAALDQLDAAKLTPPAQADLAALRTTIANNTRQLDTHAAANAQVAPFLPFAPEIIQLEEARRRMETMDAEKAAGTLNEAAKKLLAIRTAFQAQIADPATPAIPARYNVRLVTRAAEAVDKTQADLRAWFNFYNEYDPLFSWWMAAPYKEVDAGLGDYAALLRDKIAPTAPPTSPTDDLPEAAVAITPADPPQFHSVPDLRHLISLPNNEMRTITQRYNASRRGGRGGRGGDNRGADSRGGDARGNRANDAADQDAANPSPPIARGRGRGAGGGQGGGGAENAPPIVPLPQVPPDQFLAALQKIDFHKLSRNAQIDYLRLRHNAQVEIKRPLLPANTTVRKPDDNAIPGNPIGPAALQLDLEAEMIPYTPEELIAIGQAEYAWCIDELRKAAREMGLGDDWRAAIERTKSKHAPPGKQPDAIRDIIRLDLAFLRDRNLITVPQVAEEALRMEMMSPQRQLINPFFTGGSLISVSFPTSTMSHDAKIESMRGNNWGFALATVHHELIPGHNLQGFTAQRFSSLRGGGAGGTPFWGEGWACYWEMIFLNNGFAKTPEDRVGFLWWRMMRCSRIVFSFNFHLGRFSPNECVDYIVDSINSERKNAAAEVRRSFGGGYSPVYQAAYLLGAIQLRSLHNDLVQSGRMNQKTFHDTILENGPMPIALVRLSLTDTPLSPNMDLTWKFAGTHPGQGITAPFAAPRP